MVWYLISYERKKRRKVLRSSGKRKLRRKVSNVVEKEKEEESCDCEEEQEEEEGIGTQKGIEMLKLRREAETV